MGGNATDSEKAGALFDRAVTRDSADVEKTVDAMASDLDVHALQAQLEQAREASQDEQAMNLRDGIRLYPRAILWSMALSLAIVMEGFDVVLLGSFYAYPEFNRKFGVLQADGKYLISSAWQAGLSNGTQVGSIVGLAINGWASERFGYKKTMTVALLVMIATIFTPVFAPRIEVLLVGQILMGIPWGVFQTLTTAYAADVCPQSLRPILTTYVNLCWVMGQLLASGVLRALLGRTDQWGYRIPFMLQWVWPVPILIATLFAPESPWWLVRQGRTEEAKHVMRRLASPAHTSFDAEKVVALMVHTNALEKSISSGTSYIDCFKGVDLRRTEIAAITWMTQNWSGAAFMGYSTYFLVQAGFDTERAFDMSLGQYAIGFVGTVLSWFIMPHFGRRTIFLYGFAALFVLLMTVGFLGLAPGNTNAVWAVGAMLLIYTFIYDFTIGPVCYCLVAELPSTRLRAKTIVIARAAYNVTGIVNAIIMPKFLNPDALNWGAKTGWFWAGMCGLCGIYCYFRLPEPKGRTYGELDVLFEQRVSARKFSTTAVDQFSSGHRVDSVTGEKKREVAHNEYM